MRPGRRECLAMQKLWDSYALPAGAVIIIGVLIWSIWFH
jgi:hypothetical protein